MLFKRQFSIRFKQFHSWTLPSGHDTSISVYNCVTRRNEPLIVRNRNAVTWYTCGPTVYDDSHVGHGSCYVKLDVIQRILRHHFGLNLVTCMNITDIDDKIIKKAQQMKVDVSEVSRKYEKDFWTDLSALDVRKPDIVLRVTEHIPLIVDFIKKLENDGVAYKATDNSVYFDSSRSCHSPGRLQNVNDEAYESNNPHKIAPADFALWKSVKFEGEPCFDSPWGKGRPGWHIECSALASLVFGANIDIHAGGLDLRFPHHENEETQSCAFHDNHQWVNYWMHTGHLYLKHSSKMSKSLKNTVSIREMLSSTSADVFRMACTMTHYNKPMEYTEGLLRTAKNVLENYRNFLSTCVEVKRGILKPSLNNDELMRLLRDSVEGIHKAYCDDFNTPQVIAVLNKLVTEANSMVYSTATRASSNTAEPIYYLLALGNILSRTLDLFGISNVNAESALGAEAIDDLLDILVHFRQEVRNMALKEKNQDLFRLCDNLRDNLKKCDIVVKDRGTVSSWSKQ